MTRYQKLVVARFAERIIPSSATMKNKTLKKLIAALFSPISLIYLVSTRKRPVLPYLEFVVTEKCTLRCKSCANLMQHYKSAQNYPLKQLMADADILEKRLSAIWTLQLLGGEPLMYPELEALLGHLCGKRFIKRIQVVTNGTLLPKTAVLELLKHRKITVLISNYGEKSVKLRELKALLEQSGVRYRALDYSEWMDYGDLSQKNLTQAQMSESYRHCPAAECKTLLKGKLYSCPRSAHMANLKNLPAGGECADIAGDDFPQQLRELFALPAVRACAHCNPPWDRPPIPPGEQVMH